MRSFLGAANFFHTHIPNYASCTSARYECTTAGFNWDPSTWTKDYASLFKLISLNLQRVYWLVFFSTYLIVKIEQKTF
jgi:hypothetical protein